MLTVCAISYSPANRSSLPQELEMWNMHAPPLPVFFFNFFCVENERACVISPSSCSPVPFAFLLPDALITADETACQ